MNPLDIPELKYMIVNMLDLKSIGRMVQVDKANKEFIKDMPIYVRLNSCIDNINHLSYMSYLSSRYILCEKIFIYACGNNYWHIVNNILEHDNMTDALDASLIVACRSGHLDMAKFRKRS